MTTNVPAAAIPIPRICLFARRSLNILAERTEIRIGERRHTTIAAIEALAICMPVYWMMKKKVIPVRARTSNVGKSLLSTRTLKFRFLLLTPLLWATYSLLGKKLMEKYDAFLVVAYVNMIGGLCLLPFSLAENSFHRIASMNQYEWLAILYLSFTCSLMGYYIWFYVLKKVGAAVTSTFLFVEPLITAMFAVTFVGEKLNLLIVAGGLLIFSGVYLVTKKKP